MKRIQFSVLSLLIGTASITATAQNVRPVVTTPISDFTAYAGTPVHSIDLATAFSDPDVSVVVHMNTVVGAFDLALYGEQKPITVANFLNYLNSSRYFKVDPTNGQLASTFVHRSIPGFVIQGGGFIGTVDP